MRIIKTQNFEIAANISGYESATRIAILMPGRLDTKDYINFTSHAEYLSQRGFLVIAIDPPGTWDSPGELTNYTTSSYLKATNELIDYFNNRPTLLLGHSRGGATAMLASDNPAVKGLVLVNAAYGTTTPPEAGQVQNGMLPSSRDIPPGNVRTKEQICFDLPVGYFEDGEKHDPLAALSVFKGPKMLVHASQDEFTELSEVKEIYDSLPEPKMFMEVDCKHDYRLYPEVIKSVNNTLGLFIDKYMSI